MTPNGALCHLTDAFRGCLGDRPIRDVSTPLGRTVARFVATSTPIPWPKGYRSTPEVDQEVDGTPPTAFDADMERLHATMRDFVDRLDETTMRHPVFGLMTRAQWGRWAYRHMDHHLRQFGV